MEERIEWEMERPGRMALGEYLPKLAQNALSYAYLGIRSFPLYGANEQGCCCGNRKCASPGKHPMVEGGFHAGTVDAAQLKEWFCRKGLQNIGLVTGESCWVLDVDPAASPEWYELDAEWICKTPRGGLHYYYSLPEGLTIACSVGKVAEGVDVRGLGGYVAAPPSIGVAGRYVWHKERRPGARTLAPAPDDIWNLALAATKAAPPERIDPAKEAPEGERNDYLYRLASSLRAQGIPLELAEAQILSTNARCKPPLPEREARFIVHNVYNRYPAGSVSISTLETRQEETSEFPLTDLGNAERLLFRLDGNIRYCEAFGKWLLWDGSIWRVDETGGSPIIQAAAEMARDMAAQAAGMKDETAKKYLRSWAIKCESAARINATVGLVARLKGVSVAPDELDRNPMLLSVANGVIDLHTAIVREPNKSDMITIQSPVHFDPDAECPLWESFIETCTEQDEFLTNFIQVSLGYSLTGLTAEQVLFFAYGQGANGKSTMLEVMKHVWGGYAKTIPADDLMSQQGGRTIETTLARLKSARIVCTSETSSRALAEATVKEIVGGEAIQARMLYGHPFEYRPTFKLWIAGNHKPKITNNDWGIWRRIRLIPFEHVVQDDKKDVNLREKLIAEAPGILRYCLEGLKYYLTDRLPESDRVIEATQNYRDDMDVLGEFIEENCELGIGLTVKCGSLYGNYKSWSDSTGHQAMSMTSFSMRLQDRGFAKKKSGCTRMFEGLALRDDQYEQRNVYRG